MNIDCPAYTRRPTHACCRRAPVRLLLASFGPFPSCNLPLTVNMHFTVLSFSVCLFVRALAHDGSHDQTPIAGPHQGLWYNSMNRIPGDGGTQVSSCFQQLKSIPIADPSSRQIQSFLASPPLAACPTIPASPPPMQDTILPSWVPHPQILPSTSNMSD